MGVYWRKYGRCDLQIRWILFFHLSQWFGYEMAFQNYLLRIVNHRRNSFFLWALYVVFFSIPCWMVYQVRENFYIALYLFSGSHPFRSSLKIYICTPKRRVSFVRIKRYSDISLPDIQVKNICFHFIEKSRSILEIFSFFYFQPSTEHSNLWFHDEY